VVLCLLLRFPPTWIVPVGIALLVEADFGCSCDLSIAEMFRFRRALWGRIPPDLSFVMSLMLFGPRSGARPAADVVRFESSSSPSASGAGRLLVILAMGATCFGGSDSSGSGETGR